MSAKKKSAPARGLVRNILTGVFFAAVLVLIAVFLFFRDLISADTLKGIRNLFPFGSETAAPAGELSFDEGLGNLYGFYGGKLAILSPERLALYNTSGSETFSRAVSMEHPALDTSDGRVAAYDRGGRLLLSDGTDILLELDGPVLGAKLNSRRWLAVITAQTGYRGVATVYDDKCRQRYSWFSAKRYILDAAVSPNGKRLAVVSAAQDGETLSSFLTLHDTGKKDEPETEFKIAGGLALSVLVPDNNHVCVITEGGAEFFSESEKLGAYSCGDRIFMEYAASSELLVLRLKHSETAQVSELVVLDFEGNPAATLSVGGGVRALSAQGGYFSVLAGSTLEIYNRKGEKVDSLGDCSSVREIAQQPDGSVYLITGDSARLYTPGN